MLLLWPDFLGATTCERGILTWGGAIDGTFGLDLGWASASSTHFLDTCLMDFETIRCSLLLEVIVDLDGCVVINRGVTPGIVSWYSWAAGWKLMKLCSLVWWEPGRLLGGC